MNHPPESLRWLFWDTDLEKVDCDAHAAYVIERVTGYGDLKDWRWLLNRYGADKIRAVIGASRRISPKSVNLWRLLLDIPKEEIACLRKSFQRKAANL